jgi:hypothetical protein
MMHNNWGRKLREVFDSIEDHVERRADRTPLMVEPNASRC